MPNNTNFIFRPKSASRAIPVVIAALAAIFLLLFAYARTKDVGYADAVGKTSFELCGNKSWAA
jgi:hypothetical protein